MGSRYAGTPEEVRALNVFINLFRAADTVNQGIRKQLAGYGITEPQFGVLETLYHLGPLEQHDIARKLLVSGGNITYLLDTLEKQGYITRKVKSDDRRCNRISLTDTGRDLIARIFPIQAEFIAQQMSALSESEQETIAQLLKKLGVNCRTNTKGN